MRKWFRKIRNTIHPRRRPDDGEKSDQPIDYETELFANILSFLAHEFVKRCSIDVGVTCCDICLSDAGVEIVIGGQYKTFLCPDCQIKIGIGPDGERLYPNAVCRVCGCTDDQACLRGCHWVEKDLCSSCAGAEGRWDPHELEDLGAQLEDEMRELYRTFHGKPTELEHQVDADAGELGGEDLELEHQVDAGGAHGKPTELEHQVDAGDAHGKPTELKWSTTDARHFKGLRRRRPKEEGQC